MKKLIMFFGLSILTMNLAAQSTGTVNGHVWVDLGLSVKWATCNVGASFSDDHGYYYAWGEIAPKNEYTDINSLTISTKMGDISGNPRYDAATANWGGGWRIPTKEEYRELIDNCVVRWDANRKGVILISNINSKSIFLPAAGQGANLSDYHEGCGVQVGRMGAYVSSTPYKNDVPDAFSYGLSFTKDNCYISDWFGRSGGYSVRPVIAK